MKNRLLLLLTTVFVGTIACHSWGSPERDRPELNARDLARFQNISWVKGQLPSIDGFRIKTAQLFLKGEKMIPISEAIRVKYSDSRYKDTGDLIYPEGNLLILAQAKADRFVFYIQIEDASATTAARINRKELKGYRIVQTERFSESTGATADAYHYVVPIGEGRIFILEDPNGSRKQVILRCEPIEGSNSK